MLDFVVLASCGVDGTAEGRQCPAKMPKRRPCKARRCRPSRTGRLPSSASIPAVDLGGLFAQSSRAQYSMARGHRGSGSCHGCQRLTNATSHDAILTLKTLAFGTAVNTFRGMMLPYFPISGRKVGFASITGIYLARQTLLMEDMHDIPVTKPLHSSGADIGVREAEGLRVMVWASSTCRLCYRNSFWSSSGSWMEVGAYGFSEPERQPVLDQLVQVHGLHGAYSDDTPNASSRSTLSTVAHRSNATRRSYSIYDPVQHERPPIVLVPAATILGPAGRKRSP